MYTPRIYRENDREFLCAFMRRFSFATLVSAEETRPRATHLPFVVEQRDEKLVLSSHMARANPQWKEFKKNPLLVIFQEPHGYVSPRHYEHSNNVPTWNYIAVHCYGQARILRSKVEKIALLERTFAVYEKEFQSQWETLPQTYRDGLLRGIVASEIEVQEIEGKQKLSQGKAAPERERITNHFLDSADAAENTLGEFMKKYPYKR